MKQLVSIIVPAYNVEEFIGECIQSIQNQKYGHWEAIIINDGSTDNTAGVLHELIKDDERFSVIHEPNGGVSKARNIGIQAATGTHLSFMDGDDFWQPTFLSELMEALQTKGVDMAYCGYTHLYAGGMSRGFSYPYSSGRVLLEVVNGQTQIHIGALVVKKELIDRLGLTFTEGCLVGEDQEFIWKLVAHATVQAVPKELMMYRIRSGSVIKAKWNWKKHIHAFYGFRRATDYILMKAHLDYDHQGLRQVLYKRVAYKLYKILWRMIKNGYGDDAQRLMASHECKTYLSYLDTERLAFIDRLKYKIVCSPKKILWRMAKMV